MIGQVYSDKLKLHSAYWAFKIQPNADGRPVYVLPNGTQILPETVSAEILKVVKKTAEEKLDGKEEIKDCVITVPAYFTMEQKQATQDAAKQAGLNVLSLMTEPVAAAYAYGFDHSKYDGFTLFVFDLGGGTFDVTIIKYENGNFVTKCTDGDNNLGGRDFDNVLFEYFKQQISNIDFDDPKNLRQRARLMEKCEELKINLSQSEKESLSLDDFGGKGEIEIDQAKFRSLARGLMNSITHVCKRALETSKIDHSEIDKVLLIGGASRMKIIKDHVKIIFINQLHDEKGGVSPDEAVAIGAAIRAAQLKDPVHKNEKHFVEILPIGVGIGLVENQYSIMVNRGTHFPTIVEKVYYTSKNNQEVAHIVIYEGERILADRNRKLGEVYLDKLPPGPAGEVHINVIFEFDQNGILTVHAYSASGSNVSFTINYKEKRDEGEPIEDLIRQIESSRVDDEGKQIIANARAKLLQNIEGIRYNIIKGAPSKAADNLKLKCNEAEEFLRNQTDVVLITQKVQELEEEAKKAFAFGVQVK